MSALLFAAANDAFDPYIVELIVVCVALVVLLVFLFIFFSFVQCGFRACWPKAPAMARVLVWCIASWKLDYALVVKQKIALVRADVEVVHAGTGHAVQQARRH